MEKTELDELEETIREAKAKLNSSYKEEEEEEQSEEEMDEASCGSHDKKESEVEEEEEVTEGKHSKTEAEHEEDMEEDEEVAESSVREMRAEARKSKTEAEHDDMEEEEIEEAKTKSEAEHDDMEEEEEMKEASLQDMVKDIITRTDVKLEAKTKTEEEDVEEDEEVTEQVEESIEELIALDNSLSEEFKSKAAIVFEAAVSEKVSAQFEELKGEYEESIREEVELKMEGIVNKVDEYLTYAIEQFVESHEETVEVQLRNEITESFISGLKDVFESHYIEMPEGRFDMYADISEKAESMEESLKEATEALTEATEELLVLKRQKIIAEASDDLYDTQAERLVKLTENLEFTDEENFAHKVQVVKETYFNNNGKSEDEEINETSNPRVQERVRIVEEEEKSELNSVMGKYVDALSRHTKNQ